MKYFTIKNLVNAYNSLEGYKAPGVDKITKKKYVEYPWWVYKKNLQKKYDKEHPHKYAQDILYTNIEYIYNCIRSDSY